jgi:hypothetical protein
MALLAAARDFCPEDRPEMRVSHAFFAGPPAPGRPASLVRYILTTS